MVKQIKKIIIRFITRKEESFAERSKILAGYRLEK